VEDSQGGKQSWRNRSGISYILRKTLVSDISELIDRKIRKKRKKIFSTIVRFKIHTEQFETRENTQNKKSEAIKLSVLTVLRLRQFATIFLV
jgi:hypothetical protein